MNEQHDDNWRETYFTPEQWASVPATASMWHVGRADPAEDERLRTAEEIRLLVLGIMVSALTPRQRLVMELYYLEIQAHMEQHHAGTLTELQQIVLETQPAPATP